MTEIIEVKNMEYVGNKNYVIEGQEMNLRTMTLKDLSEERWNSFAERANTKSFIQAMKREPVSYAEVKLWVNNLIKDTEKAPAATGAIQYA